jgi:signal transduction histidine kinase
MKTLHLHARKLTFWHTHEPMIVLAIEDVSQRLSAEREVRSLTSTLEGRVQTRTAELAEAFQHLDAFTYTVSHDLRAPLRAMNSYNQILIEDYAGKVFDQTAQDYARRVAEAARRMDRLVQDLLEYSRLTRADITVERVDLEGLVSTVLKGMEHEISEKKVEVKADGPFSAVLGHRSTLEQVLTNLLSNAAKFVPPSARPRIHVWEEIRGGWVRVWVEDQGIGIPREHQDRIFTVFERLHKQEEYPGTGIGLAIAKKAMERMGGRIGLESEVGKGSRFWIELPKG